MSHRRKTKRRQRPLPHISAAMPGDRDLAWLERYMPDRILVRADEREGAQPGAGIEYLRECWWTWQDAGDGSPRAPH